MFSNIGPKVLSFYGSQNLAAVWQRAQAGLPCYEDSQEDGVRLLETCVHEAAHITVARSLGYRNRGVAVDGSGAGLMRYLKHDSFGHNDAVIALAAGIATARKFGRKYKFGMADNVADEAAVRAILGRGFEYTYAGAAAQCEAESLVGRFWPVITSLSHELFLRRTMGERQLNEFFARWN